MLLQPTKIHIIILYCTVMTQMIKPFTVLTLAGQGGCPVIFAQTISCGGSYTETDC